MNRREPNTHRRFRIFDHAQQIFTASITGPRPTESDFEDDSFETKCKIYARRAMAAAEHFQGQLEAAYKDAYREYFEDDRRG